MKKKEAPQTAKALKGQGKKGGFIYAALSGRALMGDFQTQGVALG